MNLQQIKILEEIHHSHCRFPVFRIWFVDKSGRYNREVNDTTNGLSLEEYERLNKKGFLDVIIPFKALQSDKIE